MMGIFKRVTVFFMIAAFFGACEESEEVSFALQDISAPTNVSAVFNIAQDDTGTVTVTPTAEGASIFQVFFGDVENETATEVAPGETVTKVYGEGDFNLRIVAVGATGLTSELVRVVSISFAAPTALQPGVQVSGTDNFQVSVTPTADNATVFDVFFGEVQDEEPVTIMVGETAEYTYGMAGDYTIRVVARGAGAATAEATETVTIVPSASVTAADFVGTWIMAPEAGSLGVGPAIGDVSFFAIDAQGVIDRACYYDDEYVFGADGSFANVLGNETWIEGWQGGSDACGAPVAPHDGTADATYSYDDATKALTIIGPGAYIGLPKANNQGELPNVDVPAQIVYTVTLSGDKNTMNVVVEIGAGSGVFWQYKLIKGENAPVPITEADFHGSWVMAPEAGSLGVGPAVGDVSFFAIDAQGVIDRACYFDDVYVFGTDGSFANVLGADTWIEGWQGGGDACGAPVPPHDGSAQATFSYDAATGQLTITGAGAYIGLPKANNQGELPNVPLPDAIVYDVVLSDDRSTMNVVVEIGAGSGVFWQYKLVKAPSQSAPEIAGTWRMAPEAGSLGVGPAVGDVSFFAIDAQGLIDRACYFDDTYVFGTDGSFANVLGADTWIEGWQGGSDACGAPVAPHDGSAAATYTYDANAGTITLSGAGAYIGLPKANNQGELPNVPLPDTIVYDVVLSDGGNTMNVVVEIGAGSGVFWQYKLIKD
ncbi:hypothetical protein [Maribacter sp. 2307ULW6-5]|uniref:hypothetical protein n=1 Tax=Maribacter sp. 2307ULW6-5 TaxID=3386275 RepID=UPI0039BD67E6